MAKQVVETWPLSLMDFSKPVQTLDRPMTLDVVVGGSASGPEQITRPMHFSGTTGAHCGSHFCSPCRTEAGLSVERFVRSAKVKEDDSSTKKGKGGDKRRR